MVTNLAAGAFGVLGIACIIFFGQALRIAIDAQQFGADAGQGLPMLGWGIGALGCFVLAWLLWFV